MPKSLGLALHATPKLILNYSVNTFFADAPPELIKEMEHVRDNLIGLSESIADEQGAVLKQGFHLCALREYQKRTGKRVLVRVLKVMASKFDISQATAYRRMGLYEDQQSLKPSEAVMQAMVATNTPLLTGKERIDQRVMRITGPPPKTSDANRALKYVVEVARTRKQVVQRLKDAVDDSDADMLLHEEILSLQRLHSKLMDNDSRTRARVGRELAGKLLAIFGLPAQRIEPEALRDNERLKPAGRPKILTASGAAR